MTIPKTFLQIFQSYYTLYRGDTNYPSQTDIEYQIALQNCNTAIIDWASTDDVMWSELFETLQLAADGDKLFSQTTNYYTLPSDFSIPGGVLKIYNTQTPGGQWLVMYIKPEVMQTQALTSAYYSVFTNPNQGSLQLYFNTGPGTPPPDGWAMDYPYYRTPTLMARPNDIPDVPNPNYIIYRMLEMRFSNSRQWSAATFWGGKANQSMANMINHNAAGPPYNNNKIFDPFAGAFGQGPPDNHSAIFGM